MSSAIYAPSSPLDPSATNQQAAAAAAAAANHHRNQAHNNHPPYNAAVAAIAVTAAAALTNPQVNNQINHHTHHSPTYQPHPIPQQKMNFQTHFGHPQPAAPHLATVVAPQYASLVSPTASPVAVTPQPVAVSGIHSPPHSQVAPFMSLPSPSPSMPAALAAPSNPLSSQLQSLSLPPRLAFPKQRYQKIRTIRQTLMGKVVLYVDTTTNRKVAIKLSNKELLARGTTSSGNKVAENPLEEIRIMNILNGNLIKNGVLVNQLPPDIKDGENYVLTSLGEYEDESFLYTVLPFCGKGEFFDIVCRETRFNLSLENLLMTDDDVLKICDYGLTRHLEFVKLQMNDGTSRLQMMPFQGTQGNKPGKLGYMAPEIFSSQSFSGPLADVWSMGVVLFISLFGVPPYQVPAASDQRFQLIHTGRILQLLQAWKMENLVSPTAVDLMSRMMAPEGKRISVDEIFKHPWIREALAANEPSPTPHPTLNNRLNVASNGVIDEDTKHDADVHMYQ